MSSDTSIRIITNYDEIVEILTFYKDRLLSLSSGAVSIEELAGKYHNCGTVIEITNDLCRAGFAAFYHNDTNTGKAFISTIAVSSEYEGLGYGSMLLNEIERICSDSGMRSIALEVNKINLRAIGFYKRNGFSEINSNGQEPLYMEKTIKKEG